MTAHTVYRYLLLSVAALLLTTRLAAQQTGRVAGVVVDSDGDPLGAVNAVLRDAADSTVRPLGDVTDEEGRFTIEQVPLVGRYTLEVRLIGHRKHLVEGIILTAEKTRIDVGTIVLEEEESPHQEIEVTAQRREVMVFADRKVYAVENNLSYTATNVSELLGQIPSVQVDADGRISLRGNSNVTIMMNGRPLTMPLEQRNEMLASLPATMVKDIEIRTNPGAEFEAKNGGGIIDIITRRTIGDLLGGNVTAGGDSRIGATGGGGLYYNSDELNASLGGGLSYSEKHNTSNSTRMNFLDSINRRNEGVGATESVSNSGYGYAQVDYRFSEHVIASLSLNLHGWSSERNASGVHTLFTASDQVAERFFDTIAPLPGVKNTGGYNSASLLLRHTFGEDHTLSLDVGYNRHSYTNGNSYRSTYYRANGELDSARSTDRITRLDESNSTVITRLDYENPIGDDIKLSLGGRHELNMLDDNRSTGDLDRVTGGIVPDTAQTRHYLPRNTTYALYGSTEFVPVEGLSVEAGVRFEHSTVSATFISGEEVISRDYTNIFPSGALAWSVAEDQSLTLSYRRSIELPDIDELNPVRVRVSDLSESSGNPELRPEFTSSIELEYSTFWEKGNMFSVTPYYSVKTGSIETTEELVGGITRQSDANFNSIYSIGSEMSLAMRPFEWLSIRLSGDLFRQVNRGSVIPGDVYSAAESYSASATISADLFEGMTLGSSLFIEGAETVGFNRDGAQTRWNLSLRQVLFDRKLALILRVNDPLNLQKWESRYSSPEFSTEATSRSRSRFIGLNISYTFGTTPRMEEHGVKDEGGRMKDEGGG